MTRGEMDREFGGVEWEVGHSYGSEGRDLAGAVAAVTLGLGRPLTGHEREQFENGWAVGCEDRAAWVRDMSDPAGVTGLPF